MKIAIDELVIKSKDIDNGKMLYEIIDFNLPSLGAIAIEFSRLPAMLGLVKKFDRAAVLTDKAWLKTIVLLSERNDGICNFGRLVIISINQYLRDVWFSGKKSKSVVEF